MTTPCPQVSLRALLQATLLLVGCAATNPEVRSERRSAPAKLGACEGSNVAVRAYLETINTTKDKMPETAALLRAFPKGADLHNHLTGSIMPEDYIALGSAEGDCFGPDPKVAGKYTIAAAVAPGRCASDFKLLEDAADGERQNLLRSLSMYRFGDDGPMSVQAGHDQFFATFGRFETISHARANIGLMLAKLLQQASRDQVLYVETMASFGGSDVSGMAQRLRQQYPTADAFAQTASYSAMYDFLLSAGLQAAVIAAQQEIAFYLKSMEEALQCNAAAADPACSVSVRFQAAINRNAALKDGSADLWKMFTQVALSATLADQEPRVVGLNLVSGEDLAVSMQSFGRQMAFMSFVAEKFPRVHVALHAGELSPCFVGDARALLDHLTGSVEAGARRLGHGVSFAYLGEAEKAAVAEQMRGRKVLVELPLTSNAQILGVAGDEHPFEQYFRKHHVPVALSTDDQGVSYLDYTSAWIYAATRYHLTYDELVRLGRASLEHSFLPGSSLWADDSPQVAQACAKDALGGSQPTEPCKSFLAGNEKAAVQWSYEGKLADFGQKHGERLRGLLSQMGTR